MWSREHRSQRDTEPAVRGDPAGAPGKRTLTMDLEAAPSREPPVAGGLPADLRARMEHQFGADFSAIRIHQNSAQPSQIGADACATGNDLHFAPGAYDPDSTAGLQLIGHELAHVVQQRQGRVPAQPSPGSGDAKRSLPRLQLGQAQPKPDAAAGGAVLVDPALEREADTIGDRIAGDEVVAMGDGGARTDAVQPGKTKRTKNNTSRTPSSGHRKQKKGKKHKAPDQLQSRQEPSMQLDTTTNQTLDDDEQRLPQHGEELVDDDQQEDEQLNLVKRQLFFAQHVGSQAAEAIMGKGNELSEQYEQRLGHALDTVEQPMFEEHSLALDTNILSGIAELQRGTPWGNLQPNKKYAVNYLRTRAQQRLAPILDDSVTFPNQATLTDIIGGGYDLRAANATLAELPDNTIPYHGLKVIVPRDSEVYLLAIQLLTMANVGQNKGAADRSIIADLLFSEGYKPRFITSDVNVFARLYEFFGPNQGLDMVGQTGSNGHRMSLSQVITELYPDGFDISIGFRKMTIIPIPGR